MLGFQTELKLASLFRFIAENEKLIECARQALAEQNEFEPNTAFKRIDRSSNGYLSIYDIQRLLKYFKIFFPLIFFGYY